jgi:hypothetical protein
LVLQVPDPDPLVRDPDLNPGSFSFLKYCLQKSILTQNFSKIVKAEKNVPVGNLKEKNMGEKYFFFFILKVRVGV